MGCYGNARQRSWLMPSRRSNAAIPAGSPIAAAVDELLALLNDQNQLEPAALAVHRQPATAAPRLFDHTVGGLCLISQLPPALARVAERCFPGDGPVERRILRAARRAVPHCADAR